MTEAEAYAWECAENMRGWAQRAEANASELREEVYRLRREIAALKCEAVEALPPEQITIDEALAAVPP